MGGIFAGFATISILIGVGILLAHVGLVDAGGQRTLAVITFYVASPALLVTMLSGSNVHELFSRNLIATGGAVVVSGALAALAARARRLALGEAVISVYAASYVNAANLGIPIAVYVLGDASLVVPTLLLQLVVLQPVGLTLLDAAVAHERLTVRAALSRPVRNPMTIGSVLGLVMALTGFELPTVVADPLALLGGMAVPGMLLAYGISLRLGPLPGRGAPAAQLGTAVGLKMVLQPLAAYLIGRYLLGMTGDPLLAVTVLSALPTAQNIFVTAVRYDRGVLLARDAVFVSTILALPVVLVISALLARH
ncbi:AEC family transporter [Nocardioides sp.]|uniref:AEC family transporter n=1 Tax=Nocardioides sp. TaxID=35761 RepID=UPI0039E2D260